MNNKELKVISLGMGMQSTAMYLMSCLGDLPTADYAVFSDPGAEHPDTNKLAKWVVDYSKTSNIPISVITQDIIRDIMSPGRSASLPYFTANGGMVMRQCTNDYKIEPVMREIRRLQGLKRGQRALPVEIWIGITTDEAHRMKDSKKHNVTNRYPLIELRMSRGDCMNWLRRHGFPQPRKSSCIFCPYQSDNNWRELKKKYPLTFGEAVNVDNAIRNSAKAKEEWFLHRSLKPIEDIDFDSEQLDMFGDECEGYCGL